MRQRLNLKAGAQVSIDLQGEAIIIRLMSGGTDWHTMRGMFGGGPGLLEDLAADHAAEVDRDNDRIQRS